MLSCCSKKEGNSCWSTFSKYADIGYDVIALTISTSDFITDALVVADFYNKGRMVFFWISIVVFSNFSFFFRNIMKKGENVFEEKIYCSFSSIFKFLISFPQMSVTETCFFWKGATEFTVTKTIIFCFFL